MFQVIVIFAATFLFAFLVPCKGLIEKLNEREVKGVGNLAREPENRKIAD